MTRMSRPTCSAQSSVAAVTLEPVSSTIVCGYRSSESCVEQRIPFCACCGCEVIRGVEQLKC